MPVNLAPIDPAALFPVAGVTLSYAEAAVKKPGRKDVLLIELAQGCQVVGVFTRNRFCAAPVHLCRSHLASGLPMRALVVNTGNANAGTGEDGRQRALAADHRASLERLYLLALETDPQRQVTVWQSASENFGSGVSAEKLRRDRKSVV